MMAAPAPRGSASVDGARPLPERFAAPDMRDADGRRSGQPIRSGAKHSLDARIVVDILFAAVFVALMATATVEETPHEWLGIAAFVLFATHQVLNRHWWAALARGRWNMLRVVSTAATLGVTACLLGQVASSLVLSEHAFSWLPAFPGASWARIVHLVCSYWGFVLAFIHTGLCLRRYRGRASQRRKRQGASVTQWLARAGAAAVVCAGAWSFAQLNMGTYLLLQSQFVFVDLTVPLAVRATEYALVGGGLACCSYAAGAVLQRLSHRRGEAGARNARRMSIPRGQSHPVAPRRSFEDEKG